MDQYWRTFCTVIGGENKQKQVYTVIIINTELGERKVDCWFIS